MSEEQIRAEFEAWYRDKFCKTLSCMATDEMMYIGTNGEYSSFHVRGAWEGWQAALDQVLGEPVAYKIISKDGHVSLLGEGAAKVDWLPLGCKCEPPYAPKEQS